MLSTWTTTLASGAALCYSTMAASEMNASSLETDLAGNGLTSVVNADSSPSLVPQEPQLKDEKVVVASPPQPRGQGRERGKRGLKVLFLSSDTGGGHRASAESLANQFELLYPGSTYELLDVASEAYLPPYNSIVSYYKHLSAHPTQWKILYGFSNSKAMERVVDTNIKFMSLMCERSMRKKLKSYDADVVVSVHPLMTSIPNLSCTKISHETGKHLPMFTVVTDLGSAHSTWFAPGVEKLFVGSQQIYDLARQRKVPEEKLVLVGLPIRHDFSIQAEKFGDRMSPEGKMYQRQVRRDLKLPFVDRKTLLLMGGGEGVGSLSSIVDALYVELVRQGIDAIILVVCGRNDKLKQSLEERDWASVFEQRRSNRKGFATTMSTAYFSDLGGCVEATSAAGCIESGLVSQSLRRILSSGSLMPSESAVFIPSPTHVGEEVKQGENGKELRRNSNSIGAIEYHEDHGKSQDSAESSLSKHPSCRRCH
jgi:UDP-N-acetylglucosamine:LPS N-acetylglucosamine transferase